MFKLIREFYQNNFQKDKKLEFINEEMIRITSGQIRSDDQIWMAYLWCEYFFDKFDNNVILFDFKMQSHDGFSCDGFEILLNQKHCQKYKIVMIMREVILIDNCGTTIDQKVINFQEDGTFQIVQAVISMFYSLNIGEK
ncbi:hypothetical protein [Vibrio phage phiKT1024]|nr:hypothetical protein [Vibrio phage phiKT1024]